MDVSNKSVTVAAPGAKRSARSMTDNGGLAMSGSATAETLSVRLSPAARRLELGARDRMSDTGSSRGVQRRYRNV